MLIQGNLHKASCIIVRSLYIERAGRKEINQDAEAAGMKLVVALLFVCQVCVQVIDGRPDGAPVAACAKMAPNHKTTAQTSYCPYSTTPEKVSHASIN